MNSIIRLWYPLTIHGRYCFFFLKKILIVVNVIYPNLANKKVAMLMISYTYERG